MSSDPSIVPSELPALDSTVTASTSDAAPTSAPAAAPSAPSEIVTPSFPFAPLSNPEPAVDKLSSSSDPSAPPEADNEAALLLLSFGAAGGEDEEVVNLALEDKQDVEMKGKVAMKDEPSVAATPATEVVSSVVTPPKQPLLAISPNPQVSHPASIPVATGEEKEMRISTSFQGLPQQMPPPPLIRSGSPHGVTPVSAIAIVKRCDIEIDDSLDMPQSSHPSASSSTSFYRPSPQTPSQYSPTVNDIGNSKSVSFAPSAVLDGVGQQPLGPGPIMGRFDVKPTINGTSFEDLYGTAPTPSRDYMGMIADNDMTQSLANGKKPAQVQRKRKRSTSTSASTSGDRQGSLPLAPLAVIPQQLNNIPSAPAPTNPHIRPDLPHFMGIDNQTYRCICSTSVEPDKGTSTQCESCCAWQHAECFGLTEDDLDSVSSYFCHLCKPRDIHRNEGYIAELVAIEKASAILAMDEGVPMGTGSRGGKKSRGGGKSRARAREPSITAQSMTDVPATPGSTTWSQPPGTEESPGPTTVVQDMPPPVSTTRPPRKKPAQTRPLKTRVVPGFKGIPSPSATPAGSTVPGSPESGAKDLPSVPTFINAPPPSVNVQPSTLSTEPIAGSLALRILEYTPTSKNIPHGPRVRKIMAQFLDQWMDRHDFDAAQKEETIQITNALADKVTRVVAESGQADDGGEMEVDSEQPQEAQRSASEASARKRRHLSPSWGSDADYAILGAPVPPVILQGPTLSSLASRVEVREEKDDSSVLPLGMATSPALADTRFDIYTRPTVYGVHALKSAPEGTYFGEFRGEIMTADDYQSNRINQYVELGLTKPQVHRIGPPLDLIIDARRYGNDLRFIRSGCHPNVVLRPLLHYDDNDESANVELSFGIFASTRIPAGKELVIGWEWDDHHILHNLRAYALEVEASGSFPSSAYTLPQAVQQKYSVVMSCISGLFPSCACAERMDCALVQMQRLGAGLPMLTEKDKDGRSKHRHRKMIASDKAVKLDLGPLVGAARSWRATAANLRSAEAIQSKLNELQPLTLTEPVPPEDQEEVEPVDGARGIEADETCVVRFEKDPVLRERTSLPKDDPDEDVNMDVPGAQAMSPSKPRSTRSVATPESKIPELAPPDLTEGSSATTTSNRSIKSGVRQRDTSATTGDSSLSSLGAIQDLAEPDAGEISDSSTLTEPLTHASLSEQDDDFPEVESRIIKVVSHKSPKVRVKKVHHKSAQRSDGFRKNRRVMSPSSPIIASGHDAEPEDTSSPVPEEPILKKPQKPILDVHFQPVKKPKRKRIEPDARSSEKRSPAPVKTKLEDEDSKAQPQANREAGMTPEIEELAVATAAPTSGTPEPEVSTSTGEHNSSALASSAADLNPTAALPVSTAEAPSAEPPAEAASVEVAPPPKKRRIDLKRFAVAAQPTEGEPSLQTPSSELATPLEPPSVQTNSLLGLNGFYPWSTADPSKTSEPIVEPKVPQTEESNGKLAEETTSNWWARAASNRSFSLSSQLHDHLTSTRPSGETNSASNSPERPSPSEIAAVNGLSPAGTPSRKSSGTYEAIDRPFAGNRASVTPLSVTQGLPNGNGLSASEGPNDHPDVKPATNSRDENAHLYQEKEVDVKPLVNGHGVDEESRWSALPAALPRRDAPPHVDTDKERFGYTGRSSPPPKHPPTGPRSGWPRDEQSDHDRRDDRDWESRDVPRGPRSDFRGRAPSTSFASPSRPPSAFPVPSTRGSPYTPRGGWHGDSYRGGSRGRGEPYRGRGAFTRGRGAGGTGGFYSTVRGRP